ncbi:glycerol kinase-like [Adelges cooleyi]|uniref:glycerol kinase-like n=1 Tax=Adelges cooleyi TaxID=133065 RepID=UPI00217F9288|nr:glycerol kinase-like [Adelges cooleyi]
MAVRPQAELIGALSVESDLVSFAVFSTTTGQEVATSSKRLPMLTTGSSSSDCRQPAAAWQPGWVEQEPAKVWAAVNEVVANVSNEMCRSGLPVTYIKALGVTNEPGTVLAWDAETGGVLCNAVHRTDARAADGPDAAVEWLTRHSEPVKRAGHKCRFGTWDTWTLWMLTSGQVYTTDVTNASQTRLMALPGPEWDESVCRDRNICVASLPPIRAPSPSTLYAVVTVGELIGLSVYSVMSRPNAVLCGHGCDSAGQASVTMDERGVTVMCVTGRSPVTSSALTAVVACVTADHKANSAMLYALQATSQVNMAVASLVSNLALFKSTAECMNVYCTAGPSTPAYMATEEGVSSAPYGRADAGGIMCGITGDTSKEHLARAAVDSMCFTVADAFNASQSDSRKSVHTAFMDGSYSEYDDVLQQQADVCGIRVIKNHRRDMAVYGVAVAAGLAVNIKFGNHRCDPDVYDPKSSAEQRAQWQKQWGKCVQRSYGWNRIGGRLTDDFS